MDFLWRRDGDIGRGPPPLAHLAKNKFLRDFAVLAEPQGSNLSFRQNKTSYPLGRLSYSGGEMGIRTPGTVARTHAFQACSLNHSDTSPCLVILAYDSLIKC